MCQARNASNAPTRSYYAEGEFVPGSPGQAYHYGVDQIGSGRRVFASTSSAPAYGYDPYGNPLQVTAPLTDFGYAGMLFRAYDPVAGRWLSRDPIGEISDPTANLYRYVISNPISLMDDLGLALQCSPDGAGPPPTPPFGTSPIDDQIAADNQAENKVVRDIVVKLRLTPYQQRLLHIE